jgi:hypothetical protein
LFVCSFSSFLGGLECLGVARGIMKEEEGEEEMMMAIVVG